MDEVPKENMVSVNFPRALFSFLDFLTLEAGTERVSQNISKELPLYLHIISEEHRSHMMVRQCRPWFSSAWSSSEPSSLDWSTFGTSHANLRPYIFNPLHRNGKLENKVPVFECPSQPKGKTLSHNAMHFLKFSAFIITHLRVLYTIFVLKGCRGIKDCVKFNFSQNYH